MILMAVKNNKNQKSSLNISLKNFRAILRILKDFFRNCYFKLVPDKKFLFQGFEFHYFRHAYNRAWENERTIEVPIVYEFIKRNRGKKILEIGNVLSNYYSFLRHDIVDKYEKARRVINEDIADFKPARLYDLIVSISTLEHISWDEEKKSPEKILKAVHHIVNNCLSPGGTFVAAVPLGYNSNLDNLIEAKKLGFDRFYYLKRISADNRWVEIAEKDAFGAKFGEPFPNGNVEVICIFGPGIF
jgi:hypothetical protein